MPNNTVPIYDRFLIDVPDDWTFDGDGKCRFDSPDEMLSIIIKAYVGTSGVTRLLLKDFAQNYFDEGYKEVGEIEELKYGHCWHLAYDEELHVMPSVCTYKFNKEKSVLIFICTGHADCFQNGGEQIKDIINSIQPVRKL